MSESKLTRRNVLKATGAVTAASAVSLGSDQTNEAAENRNTAPDATANISYRLNSRNWNNCGKSTWQVNLKTRVH